MCGRNTENHPIREYERMANFHRKQHIIMKFMHEEKYIVFNDIGMNRRKMELYDGVKVLLAIVM